MTKPETEGAEAASATDSGAPKSTFTGVARKRSTRRSVLIADKLARFSITVGGIGTIIAVLGVMVFLVWVVVPLFLPAQVEDVQAYDRDSSEKLLHVAVDEYQVLSWVLRPSGMIEVFRLDNGELREQIQLFEEGQLVSSSFLIRGDLAAFGLADGTVKLAEIGFDTKIVNADRMAPEVISALEADPANAVSHEQGVVELTPTGQYRVQTLRIEMGETTRIATGPVHRVAHVVRSSGPLIVAIAEGGSPGASEAGDDSAAEIPEPGALRLVAISGEESSNFLTGKTVLEFSPPADLPFDAPPRPGVPSHLAVNGAGSDVFVAWDDGMLMRVRRSETREAFVAEQGSLLPDGGKLESLGFVLGNTTLLWGNSDGVVKAGFTVPTEGLGDDVVGLIDAAHHEQSREIFAKTKDLSARGAAAVALASSARSRLMLTGFADGEIRLYNITNATELGKFRLPSGEPVLELAMAPKEDGLLAVTPSRFYRAKFDVRHPEASSKALFLPVWYEGYNQAQHTWQSSSGTDDFEMKLGLWPLIFGTLKATLYSMLFGAPLALLAAIYTSEFLNHRAKAIIKPSIELMASLPSVVLGFLAALVIAPFIEEIVPAALATFIGLPLAFLIGAYCWQLLPVRLAMIYHNWRFPLMILAMVPGVWAGFVIGPLAERWLFGGDIKGWLAWEPGAEGAELYGSAVGGWMLLLLPLCGVLVLFAVSRFIDPILRRRGSRRAEGAPTEGWDRRTYAMVDFGKFLAAAGATLALALVISSMLDGLGLDPRGSYIDTYVQRNALIVGFVMGFAIIPIIYTISEDALSTVPEHLRSASLGAGATPWQTATRIIIPTAMSGLFSAMMIGLGRAVGETMIVLMAAGNTPVLEWNIFNGFRTLSANIAVELPEAVQGSTHYRTLFLAALVLFIMTFAVNTVAEIIRLRFRKRAYQL